MTMECFHFWGITPDDHILLNTMTIESRAKVGRLCMKQYGILYTVLHCRYYIIKAMIYYLWIVVGMRESRWGQLKETREVSWLVSWVLMLWLLIFGRTVSIITIISMDEMLNVFTILKGFGSECVISILYLNWLLKLIFKFGIFSKAFFCR